MNNIPNVFHNIVLKYKTNIDQIKGGRLIYVY